MNDSSKPNEKVICYDENNLLLARKHRHHHDASSSKMLNINSRNSAGYFHNDDTSKNHHSRVAIPKLNIGGGSLRRPMTQGRNANNNASLVPSINEQFNLKLIQHGPDNGVPLDELPTPTRSSLRSSQNPFRRSIKPTSRSGQGATILEDN